MERLCVRNLVGGIFLCIVQLIVITVKLLMMRLGSISV